ncbi:hypothetical protein [Pseudomonas panipatensis]|uniref:hypothetical protein n=1 Tax=Pseudomonas panipatensis TaxID=428992 RepID=UPI0011144901|nr:hypothetical protein [Pseudomonas panipatensis]
MDINLTEIERSIRFYGPPGLLMLAGGVGSLLIDPSGASLNPIDQIFMPLKQGLSMLAATAMVAGAVWGLWRVGVEYRWSRGLLDGGCERCDGPVRHKEGRWGPYSKCLMCGSTSKGWH